MAVRFQDYYEILGVSRSASQDEIQRAYRRLARRYHPDVNQEPDAEEQFKRINEAHAVLGDPEKRRLYDSLGENWEAGQHVDPPPDWRGAGFRFHRQNGEGGRGSQSTGFGGFTAGDFSDFFEAFFGSSAFGGSGFAGPGAGPGDIEWTVDERGGRRRTARGRGARRRGADQEAEIEITLAEAVHGVRKQIRLESIEPDASGQPRPASKAFDVRIPAGVVEGSRVRLGGQGGRGTHGAGSGDLYLRIRLAPDPRYRVDGKDVEMTLPVTPSEAALGAQIEVPTLDGSIRLRIPAGLPRGRRLRLRGRGLGRGDARGDLYIQIEVVVPEHLRTRERELYEELSRASSFDPRGGGAGEPPHDDGSGGRK
ncbi:MAG: DnaJ C-terminal domain-containing protein [Candidatus Eiseniibacteriota bacterium]